MDAAQAIDLVQSLPPRGAWIEIDPETAQLYHRLSQVAPPTGSVD